MTDSRGSVTGKRIIVEIVQEMRDGLHPLLYSRVAPGLYCVYLHPDDFSDLDGLVPRIRVEAQRALNEELERLNTVSSSPTALRWFVATEAAPPVEAPAGGWAIQIEPDLDGEVARGTFVILSKLTLPPLPQFEGGTPTTKVFKTIVSGATRTKTEQIFAEKPSAPVPPPPPLPLSPLPSAMPSPLPSLSPSLPLVPEAAPRTAAFGPPTEPGPGRGLAEIAVEDARGARVFVMDKHDIKIGRGGQFRIVDLQIEGSIRISRVHARIRRDEQGRFFIKDLSEWGTTVNGRRIARGVVREGDDVREIDVEAELPSEARIGIAEAVFLDFKASAAAAVAEGSGA